MKAPTREEILAMDEATFAKLAQAVASEPAVFVDRDFAEQTAFIEDQSDHIALLCTRRAGKSSGIIRRICEDAKTHPGANYLYCGLTLDSARKSVWKDGFLAINDELDLGLDPNETHSTITFPNRAVVYVIGMDRPEQLRKARGGKYRGAVVDEAQDFAPHVLLSLVVDVIEPALTDNMGWLVLAGTPGAVPLGLYFDLTGDLDPQRGDVEVRVNRDTAARWRLRSWNTHANPHMRKQIEKKIAQMMEANPRIVETPGFIRERLGKWVKDVKGIVYRYVRGHNDFDGVLPAFNGAGGWHYVLGVDLGWQDPTAFVVMAYHDFDKHLYIIECEKESELIIPKVIERIEDYRRKYDFDTMVIDGSARQTVETMRAQYGLSLTAADRKDKAEHIDLVNGALVMGELLLNPATCAPLIKELDELVWDPRRLDKGKREEHPSCDNHLTDAMLYGYNHCYQYLYEQPKKQAERDSEEWVSEEKERRMEKQRQSLLADDQQGAAWTFGDEPDLGGGL